MLDLFVAILQSEKQKEKNETGTSSGNDSMYHIFPILATMIREFTQVRLEEVRSRTG
ncbi:MAG: hypothetical protein HQK60_09525 [Deltaproteobacteria bacterium]|nr:hypothetical protein [Deltaproteobacteria bacterium]